MQSLKKYVMFLLMAGFVASLAILPARAQSAGAAVSIPFDFSVGKLHLKAGDYRIQPSGTLGTFLAFSSDGNTKYTLLMPSEKAALHEGQPYLVFHRYGSEVFLRKLVLSAEKTYDLPSTSREKEILASVTSGEQVDIPIGSAR
jgi:hypothetical protein